MIVNALLSLPNGVISAGWDRKLVFWDLDTQKVIREYQCDAYINTMAWLDPIKKHVLAGGANGFLALVQM